MRTQANLLLALCPTANLNVGRAFTMALEIRTWGLAVQINANFHFIMRTRNCRARHFNEKILFLSAAPTQIPYITYALNQGHCLITCRTILDIG